jgi:hypothetical protein
MTDKVETEPMAVEEEKSSEEVAPTSPTLTFAGAVKQTCSTSVFVVIDFSISVAYRYLKDYFIHQQRS